MVLAKIEVLAPEKEKVEVVILVLAVVSLL